MTKNMWGRFVGFGQTMTGLLGILFIISVIKTLVTQFLACFDVYRKEGKVHPKMFYYTITCEISWIFMDIQKILNIARDFSKAIVRTRDG